MYLTGWVIRERYATEANTAPTYVPTYLTYRNQGKLCRVRRRKVSRHASSHAWVVVCCLFVFVFLVCVCFVCYLIILLSTLSLWFPVDMWIPKYVNTGRTSGIPGTSVRIHRRRTMWKYFRRDWKAWSATCQGRGVMWLFVRIEEKRTRRRE